MTELSVEELERWRLSGRSFVLLDVREAHELAVASIGGALHVPMREIPARIGEIDRDAEIAVLCHHGARSRHAAMYLAANGFERVYNVDGGIDAYARRVDSSVGTY
ncbi:MAG TPA: rhodanese-like domain-containing protein [Candidatus Baltobacteraceae bacterium]|nr:rhodanese-like domain-containing protein [Candidatus Baltobacteraceae bacterium]